MRFSADEDCNDDRVHVTQITKSEPVTKTITETCNGKKYPQACYHYYSAIHNYDWVKSTYECTDSNSRVRVQATSDWTKQHSDKTWRSYTINVEDNKEPKCQAD